MYYHIKSVYLLKKLTPYPLHDHIDSFQLKSVRWLDLPVGERHITKTRTM